MRNKKIVSLLTAVMLLTVGCSEGKVVEKITEDTKPSETITTEVETVGKDMEVSQSKDDTIAKEESTTKKEETTTKKVESTTKKEETTTKQESTTKKQETTTKKQETTTKKQETTTKKQETTTKKQQSTTTKAPSKTTNNNTQSAPGNKPSGGATVEIQASVAAVDEANKIIKNIVKDNMSEYEIVKAIHDWIVINVDYDYDGLRNGTIGDIEYKAEGALKYKLAVCQGYAEAFQLLCAKAGIQSYMMYGEAGNSTDGWENHAWNVVRINGEWYQIDCTWDDPLINGQVVTGSANLVYAYFLLTDEEMYCDHKLDKDYTPNEKVCKSTLFYGYAKYLTLDKYLDESVNSKRVSTAAQFKDTIKNYTKQGVYNFIVQVPTSVGDTQSMISAAVYDGFVESGVFGSYSISYSYRQVFDYLVYDMEITVSY